MYRSLVPKLISRIREEIRMTAMVLAKAKAFSERKSAGSAPRKLLSTTKMQTCFADIQPSAARFFPAASPVPARSTRESSLSTSREHGHSLCSHMS
jgi:hypothetical protein